MKKANLKTKLSPLLQSTTFYYYLLLLFILRTCPLLIFGGSKFEVNSMSALRPLPALRPSANSLMHNKFYSPHRLAGLITNKEENYGYSKFVHEE